ncbi:MAG: sulfite oxidase-like oxidoreductase [Acidimicrobiales bacterium]
MGFFDRNRKELESRGIAADRLPPGQYFTERFPVLHAGSVPIYKDLSSWNLRIFGEVDQEVTLSFDDLLALPQSTLLTDIHCVTKWSKFDTTWTGVAFSEIEKLVAPRASATHVMCHAEFGFTANLPLVDVRSEPALLAHSFDDKPLEPDHGYPLRFLFPRLYFWKSAKWLRGLEFLDSDRPGFWERNGYHMYGDPWKEQRYWE